MEEEGKKISFGFSKLAKPKVSIISNKKDINKDESVEFIDCVEDKSIKIKNEGPKKSDILVIPLKKLSSSNIKNSDLLDKILNTSVSASDNKEEEKTTISDVSNPQISNRLESLDEIAAREIIEDLKKVKDENDEQNNFSVPLTTNAPLGENESTLEDYESIPIDKFGAAMLRGMGWSPGKGIGKNEKVVAAKQPVLRPKGLGLGADKVIKTAETSGATNEPVKLVKGSFVRVIAGAHKDLFGEIIGFDDETGRLIVKMTLSGSVLTFNEFMVQPVSKEDFNKNSRVINVKKFEEYKSREDNKGVIETLKHKSNKYRGSSVSSNGSDDEKEVKTSKVKYRNERRSSSPENLIDEEVTSRKSRTYRSSSKDDLSRLHKVKSYDKHTSGREISKAKYYDSPDRNTSKHYTRPITESSRYKRRSTSVDSSTARSKTKNYNRHSSRKDTRKSKQYRSSSYDSSPERHSSLKHKESKKIQTPSSDSDSSSDESYKKRKDVQVSPDAKIKSKKHKEKKKSRRHSRSVSNERKPSRRSPSPKKRKKHKKHKYN